MKHGELPDAAELRVQPSLSRKLQRSCGCPEVRLLIAAKAFLPEAHALLYAVTAASR